MLDASLLPLRNDGAGLRRLRRADAHIYVEGTTDPDVRAYAHLPEPSYTPASVAAMIDSEADAGLERGDLAVLAMTSADDEAFAGSLVIFDVTAEDAEVGFWVHPSHRGRGITVAALELAARFARDSGLASLSARTVPDNLASQRVLIRAGFNEGGRSTGTTPSGNQTELVSFVRHLGV